MFHQIVYFTCWRYLWTRKIIVLSILGVMIGVTVLIVVMSVMSGFQKDFRARLQGTLSELTFDLNDTQSDYRPLEKQMKEAFPEEIKEIAPRLECLVLVGLGKGWRGGILIGIDEKKEEVVSGFSSYLMSSKKIKSQIFQDVFQRIRKKSTTLLSSEWIIEKVENIAYPVERPLFGEAWEEEEKEEKDERPKDHFRVYFRTRSVFSNQTGDPRPSHLDSFIFDTSGLIVAHERYHYQIQDQIEKKVKALPENPVLVKKYQQVFQKMNLAFKEMDSDRLMELYHEDLEVYLFDQEGYKTYTDDHLSIGDPFDLKNWENKRYYPIIIGNEIKIRRFVFLRNPGDFTLLGGYYNREEKQIRTISKKFTAVGTFKTGMHEFDSKVIYCPLKGAQQLQIPPEVMEEIEDEFEDEDYEYPEDLKFNRITNFSIAVYDSSHLEEIKNKINAKFGEFGKAETWMDKRRVLLDAVNLEKSIMNIILNFIILLAALSIIFVLWLMVAEKQKDIGILRSMGATSNDILFIFVNNGTLIAFLGTVLGTLMGVAVALHVNELEELLFKTTGLEVFPRDVYYLDSIPVNIEPDRIAWVIGWTVIASLILSMIPARIASKADPVKCIYHR